MSVATSPSTHPSIIAVTHARDALTRASERDPIYLSPTEHGTLLHELVALTAQVAELQARVTLAAGPAGIDDATGALRTGHSQARAATRFAERLERSASVAEALRDGNITVPQADVITRAVEALPTDLDPLVRFQAELHLVDLAAEHGPAELRILGRRVLEVLAPDIAEAAEAAALANEEQTAREKTRLRLRSVGDGTTLVRGVIPDLIATRLANFLHAITNPRQHPNGTEIDPNSDDVWRTLPYPRKLGQAFCDLLERIDPRSLPDHGGTSTELIVTMSLESLQSELGTATVLGPGGAETISASEARRLACNAGVIPAVLGAKSEVLDLGRSARLASRAQRKALMAMHATCAGEHCATPTAWCEIHHLDPWATGGKTDLNNLIPLCNREHHMLHSENYHHQLLPNGKVRFTRRC